MTALALIVAGVLGPVAGLHFLWAFGVTWPLRSERELAHAVGGPSLNPSISPAAKSAITILVAGAILVAAILPLLRANVVPSPVPEQLVFWLLALQTAAFLIRGGLGYSPWSPTVQPLRRYNRRYYSPLIIILGLLCAVLVLRPLAA